jgi:hypothetical protein
LRRAKRFLEGKVNGQTDTEQYDVPQE